MEKIGIWERAPPSFCFEKGNYGRTENILDKITYFSLQSCKYLIWYFERNQTQTWKMHFSLTSIYIYIYILIEFNVIYTNGYSMFFMHRVAIRIYNILTYQKKKYLFNHQIPSSLKQRSLQQLIKLISHGKEPTLQPTISANSSSAQTNSLEIHILFKCRNFSMQRSRKLR